MIFYMIGQIIKLEAALMALPVLVALIYKEWNGAISFAGTAIVAAILGFVLTSVFKKAERTIYAKEGFVIVAIAWISMSVIGAFPFYISGEIPSYIDAFFETVSGFTTTGASILTNVEAMSHGMLFWRSFSHWIGGMGVIVLIMAILPDNSGRSIYIMRAEMPGPIVDKIVPKIRDISKILYLMYIALTVAMVAFLCTGGMSLYESLVHAFGTAGTGGFGIKADSIGSYSPYLQWVITIFMLIFGVNFNLYYLIIKRRAKSAFKSEELWCYIGIVVISAVIIASNIAPMFESTAEAVRHSSFQVASIITTTGYSTVDFNLWPTLSKSLLLVLMFIGGCAGSTAGGLKVSRIIMLAKMIGKELKLLLHPRGVITTKFEGKRLDGAQTKSVGMYFALYCFMLIAVFLSISFEPFGIETNFTAAVSCFNNVGPGLAAVGPAASYADYSGFSKLVLSAAMLFGRLEIYPILLTIIPSTWYKK
jgi:trk system potassium uptake protein TrkH